MTASILAASAAINNEITPALHTDFLMLAMFGISNNESKALNMRDVLEAVRRFEALPDDAIVPTKITAIILGVSERTIRYHAHLPRRQISPARYGQRAGDIRKLAREGFAD